MSVHRKAHPEGMSQLRRNKSLNFTVLRLHESISTARINNITRRKLILFHLRSGVMVIYFADDFKIFVNCAVSNNKNKYNK